MAGRYEFEIKEFLIEMKAIIKAAENVPNNTGIRFDPHLFMLWRASRK